MRKPGGQEYLSVLLPPGVKSCHVSWLLPVHWVRTPHMPKSLSRSVPVSAAHRSVCTKDISLQNWCHSALTLQEAVQFPHAIAARNKTSAAENAAWSDGQLTCKTHTAQLAHANFPFLPFCLLWKGIKITRLPLTGLFAVSQVITYKGTMHKY